MSLLFELVVQEDLDIGTNTVTVTSPDGGALAGTQVGIHSVAVGQTAWSLEWDPDSIAAGSYESTDLAVPGAAINDFVIASHSAVLTNVLQVTAHVSSVDTVRCVIFNPTASPVNLDSGILTVLVFKSR